MVPPTFVHARSFVQARFAAAPCDTRLHNLATRNIYGPTAPIAMASIAGTLLWTC